MNWLLFVRGVEIGDPDKKCGVHATLPLSRFFLQRPLLDNLCPYPIRSLHYRKHSLHVSLLKEGMLALK